uniref:Ankyrin repeat protein n=1 Tax=viral metagenome TaxID=1070528 RepID=A0A6C0E5W6_9ZZZZ
MHVKITNENECHYGFQYKTGLNTLDKYFDKSGSCVAGGFYITDLDNVDKFYYKGVWLRIIEIPKGAKSVKDPDDVHGEKWRLDKIILKNKYPLYNLETIKKFNLKITNYYITEVCKRGHIDILEWYLINNPSFKFSNQILNETIKCGQIKTLEWCRERNLVPIDLPILDIGSAEGHLEVLVWLQKSGLPCKYSEMAMDDASYYGHIDVLEWWLNSGLSLKYSEMALEHASWMSNINVLAWWKNSGLPLKYSENVLNLAAENGNIDVLTWWLHSGLELNYGSFIHNYNLYYHLDKNINKWFNNNKNSKVFGIS